MQLKLFDIEEKQPDFMYEQSVYKGKGDLGKYRLYATLMDGIFIAKCINKKLNNLLVEKIEGGYKQII